MRRYALQLCQKTWPYVSLMNNIICYYKQFFFVLTNICIMYQIKIQELLDLKEKTRGGTELVQEISKQANDV